MLKKTFGMLLLFGLLNSLNLQAGSPKADANYKIKPIFGIMYVKEAEEAAVIEKYSRSLHDTKETEAKNFHKGLILGLKIACAGGSTLLALTTAYTIWKKNE